jgi:hypothetical protein
MGEMKIPKKTVAGMPEEMRPSGIPKHRWRNIINLDLK